MNKTLWQEYIKKTVCKIFFCTSFISILILKTKPRDLISIFYQHRNAFIIIFTICFALYHFYNFIVEKIITRDIIKKLCLVIVGLVFVVDCIFSFDINFEDYNWYFHYFIFYAAPFIGIIIERHFSTKKCLKPLKKYFHPLKLITEKNKKSIQELFKCIIFWLIYLFICISLNLHLFRLLYDILYNQKTIKILSLKEFLIIKYWSLLIFFYKDIEIFLEIKSNEKIEKAIIRKNK